MRWCWILERAGPCPDYSRVHHFFRHRPQSPSFAEAYVLLPPMTGPGFATWRRIEEWLKWPNRGFLPPFGHLEIVSISSPVAAGVSRWNGSLAFQEMSGMEWCLSHPLKIPTALWFRSVFHRNFQHEC